MGASQSSPKKQVSTTMTNIKSKIQEPYNKVVSTNMANIKSKIQEPYNKVVSTNMANIKSKIQEPYNKVVSSNMPKNYFSNNVPSSNKESGFGDIPFFVFYSTVLARLSYFTNENFLSSYLEIFGPIIKTSLMKNINDAPIDKIFDPNIYSTSISQEKIPTYKLEGKNMIDFKEMAKQINEVNVNLIKRSMSKETVSNPVIEIKGPDYTVAYISIATSNYTGYYILVDTRMPNSIFVLFRGTYSAKSAGSYSKPSSIVPFNIAGNISQEELTKLLKENEGKMFGVLLGINKILEDVYHSIIESMVYLSQTYLKASSPNSVKVFTTGHSLGGALTTLFAADWMEFTNISPYNKAPYNIFTKKICCVSLAAPRVLSPAYSNYFCQQTIDKHILFRRVTNRGDPVPALPSKSLVGLSEGYQHPCSTKKYASTQREVINLDCGSTQIKNEIDYSKQLNCRKVKTGIMQGNLSGNVLAHTAYLYINFFNAVDLTEMAMSNIPSSFKKKTSELKRTSGGETNTRIILGVGNNMKGSIKMDLKSIFFTLNDIRPKSIDSNQTITSDLLMNQTVFNQLIKNLKPMNPSDLNPISSTNMYSPTIVDKSLMPKITGIYSRKTAQTAGKRKKSKSTTRRKK